MSKIKISPIEEVPEITEETHEPDEAAGPVDMPAPKPKRIRKKPETKEEIPPPPAEPEPIPEPKKGKLITCTNGGKELLEKTFKYYHQ